MRVKQRFKEADYVIISILTPIYTTIGLWVLGRFIYG